MANHTPQRQMSLIPYPRSEDQEIVLRRGNAVVLFDTSSQQLLVRDVSDHTLDLTECPYCHRPLRDDFEAEHDFRQGRSSGEGYGWGGEERPFVDPDYFGMLATSTRASPASSQPSTPTGRRFIPAALRSGRSRDVSGAGGPPSGAEFVASEPVAAASKGIDTSAFNPGYFKQHFQQQGELGRGGNGVVLLVEHILDGVGLGHYACKRVPVGNDHEWLKKVLVEVNLLRKTSHPNLVPCHWVWLEDHQPSAFGPSIPCLWILQEYCNGGDLHRYVLGPKEPSDIAQKLKQRLRRRSKADVPSGSGLRGPSKLTFEEIFSFFRDITSGLHHLHSKGYIHRDIKPSNCLIQRDGSQTRVLISDFGEVQAAGSKRGNSATGATGTISYCAPEVLQRDTSSGAFGDFTTKSDIFSLGMVVYFMCFGRLPYTSTDGADEDNEDLDELRTEISAWPGFNNEARARLDLPEMLYRYLRRLLSVDPNERPSTEDILTSITASGGPGEGFPSFVNDGASRVSSVDSPSRRPTPQPRRQSSILSRPGLSNLGRHRSSEHQVHRSPSPVKHARGRDSSRDSRPTSSDSAVAIRPRQIDLPPPKDTRSPSPQLSPRLMLPSPPDRSVTRSLAYAVHHPASQPLFRVALACAKFLMLSVPCSPFAANPWLLYPLLGLAVLDLGVLSFDLRRSLLLFGLHTALVYTARQRGLLCEGKSFVWDQL